MERNLTDLKETTNLNEFVPDETKDRKNRENRLRKRYLQQFRLLMGPFVSMNFFFLFKNKLRIPKSENNANEQNAKT